ncbi:MULTISPECIES: HAMP domain-containing sensor histidine kinase [unclassified Azospirillum]|uniref:sensor histidine kinase n=1 Tax=unclassified Azospirillum TaxID=2630922 RepID=UPI000B66E729|nr:MULTISPECIES: HAMP domain-containing sensor histidine kinase [unclassified Azospirillum]SNS23036.1 Signal transduction histidine kinase [Azospirillum sp. RU38E]SNS41135.1 Signal transduction histidine kinase [Azospirillum sp. RU37A]
MRWLVLSALGLLAILLGGGFLLVAEMLVADMESRARLEIDADIVALQRADQHVPLVGPLDIAMRSEQDGDAFYAMRDADGTLLGSILQSWPEAAGDDGYFYFDLPGPQGAGNGRSLLARTAKLEGGAEMLVARDLAGQTLFIRHVGLLFGSIFILFSFVMLVGAVWLGRREQQRASAILSVFQRLAQGETGSRVPPARGHDPLSRLGGMLNICLDNIDRLVGMRDWLEGALKHEMRARLTEIMLKLPETNDAMGPVHEKVEDALRAFDGIMNLSRYRVGSMLRGRRFRLDQLLIEVTRSWATEIAEKDLKLTQTITPMVMVEGQPDLLMVVLHNIVSNAIKYTPADGALRLGLIMVDGHAKVTLADTGPGLKGFPGGFAKDGRITPFRRGPAAEGKDGLGLGLCLVQEVVELHNGHLSIAEDLGGGTLVTILLPS